MLDSSQERGVRWRHSSTLLHRTCSFLFCVWRSFEGWNIGDLVFAYLQLHLLYLYSGHFLKKISAAVFPWMYLDQMKGSVIFSSASLHGAHKLVIFCGCHGKSWVTFQCAVHSGSISAFAPCTKFGFSFLGNIWFQKAGIFPVLDLQDHRDDLLGHSLKFSQSSLSCTTEVYQQVPPHHWQLSLF